MDNIYGLELSKKDLEDIKELQEAIREDYTEKHNISTSEYTKLNEKYRLDKFIAKTIDYLCDYGMPGIIIEIENYMKECDKRWAK